MRVIIKENYDNICYWVSVYLKNKINSHNKDKPFVLGLPTGSTPLGVYKNLINFYNQGKLSFKNVVTFNMDEYIGLSKENKQSYHYFMHTNFFNFIDIPKENINILDGLADDLIEECNNYENKIKSYGGIDIFLCGIGSDGHIAFNEPGSSLESKTRIKTLCLETVLDNSRFFDNIDEVPKQALTVGIDTVYSAKKVIIMASGINKAVAIRECIEGCISSQYTCTIFQKHPNSIILCDDLAAREIKHKTYLYYLHLQENIDIDGNPIIDTIKKNISITDRVVITSPHPDDDVIGMGGTMNLLPNKDNVNIYYMTNGLGGIKDDDEIGNLGRIREAMSSVMVLGYNHKKVKNCELPFYYDNERKITEKDYNKLSNIINEDDPHHLFICIDSDPKKTHTKCVKIIQNIKENASLKKVWLYQSAWGDWNNSDIKYNTSVYISKNDFERKLMSIDMHISQINPKVTKEDKINSFKDIVKVQNKSERYPGNYEEKFCVINFEEFKKLIIN